MILLNKFLISPDSKRENEKTILFQSSCFMHYRHSFQLRGGGGAPPKTFQKNSLRAMLEDDVEVLQELTTEKTTKEAIEEIDEVKKLNITISDFKVLEVKDRGKGMADVRVEFVHEESLEEGKYRKKPHDQTFHLKKVKGKWLIEKIAIASPPVSLT